MRPLSLLAVRLACKGNDAIHMKTLLNISFKNAEHTRKARIPFVCMKIHLSRVLLLPVLAFAQKKLSRREGVLQSTQDISG